MGDLTQMLEYYNPYIPIYRTAWERLQQMSHERDADELKVLLDAKLNLVMEAGTDCRHHNFPIANEVAIIMLGDETEKLT